MRWEKIGELNKGVVLEKKAVEMEEESAEYF